ncbi:cold-shock DEAD box protein-A [Actinobacillus equuli]|nr:cold-shock DEAD box protein-A [Actinobacillus equuli]
MKGVRVVTVYGGQRYDIQLRALNKVHKLLLVLRVVFLTIFVVAH